MLQAVCRPFLRHQPDGALAHDQQLVVPRRRQRFAEQPFSKAGCMRAGRFGVMLAGQRRRTHLNDMSSHVFTYGSLMFPQVWQRVVRGEYRFARATAAGYARYAITGETYPGMVGQAGSAVQGVLYFDVGPQDLAALDAFEGGEYRREEIDVTLDAGETVRASTYIYLLPEKLSESKWLPEVFQMERFIGTYCRDRLGS
jgi:gamma-glutamylcyclotransferase (GGCT)/AIG2-like uncharacterized protein YtfP